MNTQRHSRTPSWTATGFTLMELLVVLAVMALVAALLLPVFARSRERARQTVCASNLRQIGVATLQYVQDNDGALFPFSHREAKGVVVHWDYGASIAHKLDTAHGSLDPYVKSAAIWSCPSWTEPNTLPPYGLNMDFQSAERSQGHPALLATANAPAETILVADSAQFGFGRVQWAGGVSPPSSHLLFMHGRHSGSANVLWLDGHVAAGKPIAPFADIAGSGLSAAQLQGLNLGFLLKGPYTGESKTDDYYYELTKP